MTKLNPESVVVRETLADFRGRSVIVELHARYMILRLKGTQQSGTLDYSGAYEAALMRFAKLTAGDIPASKGRRKARGAETMEQAQAKLYPRRAKITDGWVGEGREMSVLGPAIESRGISWTPVQFHDDTDGPEFFKTRGITFTDTETSTE